MKKVTILTLMVLICAGIYYFSFYANTKNQKPTLNSANTIISINTRDEAIAQAKKLSKGLTNFSTKAAPDTLEETAYFQKDDNYWFVSFWPTNSVDWWYNVHLSTDGTILYEGEEAGG